MIIRMLAEDSTPNPLLPSLPDIVWSLVVLIIIGVTLARVVVPKLLRVFDERTDKIEGGLERAQQAQEKAQRTLEAYQAKLDEARTEAAKIRDDARTEGQAIIAALKAQGQEESQRIVNAGKEELEVQRRQTISDIRRELASSSVLVAEKLLGRELSSDTKKASSIDQVISELETSR